MMQCPQCKAMVETGDPFCGECGAALPRQATCPKCGNQFEPNAIFCGSCGHDLRSATTVSSFLPSTSTVPTSPSPPAGLQPGRKQNGLWIAIGVVGVLGVMLLAVGLIGWRLIAGLRATPTTPTVSERPEPSPAPVTPSATSIKSSDTEPTITLIEPTESPALKLSATPVFHPPGANPEDVVITMRRPTTAYEKTVPPTKARQLSGRRLTEADLRGKTKWQLDVMRNEIYARHGYIFRRRDLSNHFRQQPWYRPKTRDQNLIRRRLSPLEKYNSELILSYQNRYD